jgi:hypothetical protein
MPPPAPKVARPGLCPVCQLEHVAVCAKFLEAYRAHNDELRKRLARPWVPAARYRRLGDK